MIPLNVTHTAIVTKQLHSKLLGSDGSTTLADGTLPKPTSSLRHTLSTVISFFADSYKSTFGFLEGPPLHDALTIGYVSHPELFKCRRYRVDIELNGAFTSGETVVDIWQYRSCDDSWGWKGKNCLVAETVDVIIFESSYSNSPCSLAISYLQVGGFFDLFLECVSQCDKVSPLNKS